MSNELHVHRLFHPRCARNRATFRPNVRRLGVFSVVIDRSRLRHVLGIVLELTLFSVAAAPRPLTKHTPSASGNLSYLDL